VCLHLAQLDGETVDVVLNLLLALLGLGVLVSQQDAANQRMVAGGGVFERQVIGQGGGQRQRHQPGKTEADDLRNADRKRSLAPEVA